MDDSHEMPSVEATGQWTNPSTVDVCFTEICWIFTTMFDHQYHEISGLLGTKNIQPRRPPPPVNVLSFHKQHNHLASEKVSPQFARCRFSMFFHPFHILTESSRWRLLSLPPWNSSFTVSNTFPFYEQNSPQKGKCRCFPSLIWFLATFCSPLGLVAGEFQWIPAMLMLKHFLRRKFQVLWVKNSRGVCHCDSQLHGNCTPNHHWGPKNWWN